MTKQAYFLIFCLTFFLKKCKKNYVHTHTHTHQMLHIPYFTTMIKMSFFFPFERKLIACNSFDVSFSSRDESKDTGSSAGTRPFGGLFVAHYRFISVRETHDDAPRRKMKDSQNFGRC